MSHKERRATPVAFALYLLAGVRKRYQTQRVAILFTDRRTNYLRLLPWVELWGVARNAHKYAGPWPVIAHPPCGPWGKLSWSSKESKEHGIIAMEMVHRWGGVVEQPLGSQLFKLHGDGRAVERVNQVDYGHRAQKATLLYWV